MDRTRSDVSTRENARPARPARTALPDRPDLPAKYHEELAARIKNGNLKIAIYGLGHVGAPLAATWIRAGKRPILGMAPADLAAAVSAQRAVEACPRPSEWHRKE